MERSFVEVVMNPVRQRIVQYLLLHRTGTANGIAAELSDIPRASLYRHLKVLLEAGYVEISEQRAVRGTVQKTYALVARPAGAYSQQEGAQLIQSVLMSLMGTFADYFIKESADPQKDLLSVSSSVLMLSDEELMELFGKVGNALNDYIQNPPAKGRKARNIVFISAPTNQNGGA